MKACHEWREELLEAALGGELAPAAKAHIAGCMACGAALDAMRAQSAMVDAGVASQVRGGELRAGFDRRVLAAADAASQTRPGGFAWARPLAVAAVCAVVAFFVARRPEPRRTPPAAPLSQWQSPTAGLLRGADDGILHPELRLGEFYFSPPQPERKSKPERQSTRSKFL